MSEHIKYQPENENEARVLENEVTDLILSIEDELAEGPLQSRERRDELLNKLRTAHLIFGDPQLLKTKKDIEERYGKLGTE